MDGGTVVFEGKEIQNHQPRQIVQAGIARTFQNIRLFPNMRVIENVLIGEHVNIHYNFWNLLFKTPKYRREEKAAAERAIALLESLGLGDEIDNYAQNLPYGMQRKLEIARALATKAKLIILDEPAAGMNPQESEELMEFIRELRKSGVTILMIEHDMNVVMNISDRIYVIDHGRKIAEGLPAEIAKNRRGCESIFRKRRCGGVQQKKMLEVKDLYTNYGSIQALKGINLEVFEGEIVTLIGSNGAGKSTTLSSITGIVPASRGSVIFEGKEITKMKPSDITRLGIAASPEGRGVFGGLSVQENLKVGAYTRKNKKEIAESFEEVYALFPRLAERRRQAAGTLSGGEQQMLAIGRAMMSRPRLLLLDEPSMGLSPNLVDMVFDLIVKINERGTTILLIEQNANMALQIADRGYVLETGKVTLSDDAERLQANDEVRKAYLGSGEA